MSKETTIFLNEYIINSKNKYQNLELVINNIPKEEKQIDKILLNINEILNYVFNIVKIPIKNINIYSKDNLFIEELYWLILIQISQLQISNVTINMKLYPSFIKTKNFYSIFRQCYQLYKRNNLQLNVIVLADGRKIDKDKSYNYVDIIDFIENYNFSIQSNINSTNVYKWKQNYKWWQRHTDQLPIMIEDRNCWWNQESIEVYIDLLDFIFQSRFKSYDNNLELMAKDYFKNSNKYDIIKPIYNNYTSKLLCALPQTLSFNVENKNLIPCHKIINDEFKIGNLKENLLIANNPSVKIAIDNIARKSLPNCNNCLIKDFCYGNCLGDSIINCGSMFLPNESVCSLFQQKIIFLFKKLNDMNILQYGIDNSLINESFLNDINKMINKI